jgi:uncharacterized membrane protein
VTEDVLRRIAALPATPPMPDAAVRRRVDHIVYGVLFGGVIAASVLLGVGICVALVERQSLPRSLASPGDTLRGLLHLRPDALVSAGLMVLMITPVVRVIGSVAAFAVARDLRYALVAAAVLLTMATSIYWGHG